MSTFLKLTEPGGRIIALNIAHIIAVSPAVATEYDPVPTAATLIHTTIGTDRAGWHEWPVIDAFEDIMRLIDGASPMTEDEAKAVERVADVIARLKKARGDDGGSAIYDDQDAIDDAIALLEALD